MSGEEYLLSLFHKRSEQNYADAIHINQRACPFVKYFKDRLTVEYLGKGLVYNDITSIQSNKPSNRDTLIFYYEVKILNSGARGDICIGFADADFPLNKHPGWTKKSFGYKADGKVYSNKQAGNITMPKFSTGDIVGCGINFLKREIFFTHNGTYNGPAFKDVELKEYYATLSLHSLNERVAFNFGSKPFKFDIEKLTLEEKRKSANTILQQPINHYSLHQIVHSYLNFHGYTETLDAFERSAQIERKDVGLPRNEIFWEPEENAKKDIDEILEDGEPKDQKKKRKKTAEETMEVEPKESLEHQNGSNNHNGQNHTEDHHDQVAGDEIRYRSESMRIEFESHSPNFNGIKEHFNFDMEPSTLNSDKSNSQTRDFVLFKKASFCVNPHGNPLSSGDLSSQIANQLNHQNSQKSNNEPKPNTYLIHERAHLRKVLLEGNVSEAINFINKLFPSLLEEKKNLLKALHVQQFIEYIKLKDIHKAISYSQKYLTAYQKENIYCLDNQGVAQEVPIDAMMALLCYPEPENSDLKNFLGIEHRDLTADIANKEILKKMGFIDQSILDILIAQLTQMESTYREHNSYYGEVFKFGV